MSAKSKSTMTNTVTPYKQRLIAVGELLGQQAVNAYRVAVELVAVYGDVEFLSDPAIAGDDAKAVDALDAFAARLFVIPPPNRSPFLDLRAMLSHFPREEQWAGGDLAGMYATMLSEEEAGRRKDPSPNAKRRSVTVAEYDAMVTELKRTQARCARLEKQVVRLREEIRTLRAERAEPAPV